ncbi:MAG: aldehyde-activating protein [Alphaproteobacteria bacterium]|nr:aldehyde-activating protein [Alphaproteobacteria bacterium]
MFVNCCHCRDCQKQTGGGFAVNGVIERDRVALLQGAPTPHAMHTESGHPHDIWRCDACGGAVWSDYGRRGVLIFVRMTTLDDADAITPDAHIFTRSKLPWVRLPETARAFEIYYDMAVEWPPESLARRAALNLAR